MYHDTLSDPLFNVPTVSVITYTQVALTLVGVHTIVSVIITCKSTLPTKMLRVV